MRRYPYILYWLLAGFCGLVVMWQVFEHRRVKMTVRQSQLNHARSIANSLAVVIRSQRRFGTVSRSRLSAALEDLAASRDLLGVSLLSPSGEIVAFAGETLADGLGEVALGLPRLMPGKFAVAELVELGSEEMVARNRLPHYLRDLTDDELQRSSGAMVWDSDAMSPSSEGPSPENAERESRQGRLNRFRQIQAFWQEPDKYQELYEKFGLHMMVLIMDNHAAALLVRRDLYLRIAVTGFAFFAAFVLALALRSIDRSAHLQVHLARARAMNNYLRELNLAAAGLAHETRNPLNIVRGMAQTVAKDAGTTADSRTKLHVALDEVDRVTARLNEFIDYSKPREPVVAALDPLDVGREVVRALETDIDDKKLHCECQGQGQKIMADEGMLRQMLFNLILNAIQAAPQNGDVIVLTDFGHSGGEIIIKDNGPGVPEDRRVEIFRPYVSYSSRGSGLGLSIVCQIAFSHGWEVRYEANPGGGSIFRVCGLRLPKGKNNGT